ncbi:hypothetical protein K160097B7_21440 [[Clostridium] hylemonae]|uniref:hypothetical protein n=3 Tax=[Clostridium] hylemonae TaxID=89153 RepID=UPI0036F43860
MKRKRQISAVMAALLLSVNLVCTAFAQEDGVAGEPGTKQEETGTANDSADKTGDSTGKAEDEAAGPEDAADTGGTPEPEKEETEPQKEAADGGTERAPQGPGDPVNTSPASLKETDEKSAGQPVLLEGGTLYTYGAAVTLKKDSVSGGTYVYDGTGENKLIDAPVSSLNTVYGGGKNEPVKGDVSITIDGVYVSTVYGGGFSDGTGSADVDGSVSIRITGSADAGSVYGGGYAEGKKGNASANVSGSAAISALDEPANYHHYIYGGGKAYAAGAFDACADVGSTTLSVYGCTYSVRGGGSASAAAGASGTARADVKGKVTIALSKVDIREVYGAGAASGAGAQAKAGAVEITVDGNEMMILRGGGTADKEACADVAGNISIQVQNCFNLYGYLYGGGTASGGGSARAGSVDIDVTACVTPVEEQFEDYWVCHAFYGGGEASGSGSSADIKGAVSLAVSKGEVAGNIYGSGEASSGGTARSGAVSIELSDISGYFCKELGDEGQQCYPSVYAAGESDGQDESSSAPEKIKTVLQAVTAENVWGGHVDTKGNPSASACTSSLVLADSTVTDTLTCFDDIALNRPLAIRAYLGKKDGVPAQLINQGVKPGEVLVSCADTDSAADWFVLKNGELSYEVTDTASLWKIRKQTGPDQNVEVNMGQGAAGIKVNVEDSRRLADALLTEEEKKEITDGSVIGFELRVHEVDHMDSSVKAATEGAMKENQAVAASLDINLFKIKNGAETKIAEPGVSMRIVIGVPEAYRADAKRRTFSVVRVHGSAGGALTADVLQDLDTEADTVTIETDRFSVYTLIYEDVQPGTGGDINGGSGLPGGVDPEEPGGGPALRPGTNGGGAGAYGASGHGSPAETDRAGSLATGDESPAAVYILAAVCALAVITAVAGKKLRSRGNEKEKGE